MHPQFDGNSEPQSFAGFKKKEAVRILKAAETSSILQQFKWK